MGKDLQPNTAIDLSACSIWARQLVRDQLAAELNRHGSQGILNLLVPESQCPPQGTVPVEDPKPTEVPIEAGQATNANLACLSGLLYGKDALLTSVLGNAAGMSPSDLPSADNNNNKGEGGGAQPWQPDVLPTLPAKFEMRLPGGATASDPIRIGIVGGGMCGLYIAYILDALAIPNVSYEILEANKGRLGGRCYTHHFTPPPANPHAVCTKHSKCMAHKVCDNALHKRCVAHKGCNPHDACPSASPCVPTFRCTVHSPGNPNDGRTCDASNPCRDRIPCAAHADCFPEKPCEQTRTHDYYDVGAMRFPHHDMMQRFFDLCEQTSTKVIPYYHNYGSVNVPTRFNNKLFLKSNVDWKTNPFNVELRSGPPPLEDPKSLLEAAMEPYLTLLKDAKTLREKQMALRVLMTQDDINTRDHLRSHRPYYTPEMVQYLEDFAGTTDLFTAGFPVGVFQAIDFNTKDWRCIEGGTQLLPQNTAEMLKTAPELNKKIMRVALRNFHNDKQPMEVTVEGERNPRKYSAVFITTTLGCAQRMDLDDAELNWGHRTAIRSLHNTPATKMCIKFSRAWWITDCNIRKGGVATTDELLRNCVYPSYNINDDPTKPAVLLVSYAWTEDSFRIGSLISRATPHNEVELLDVMLRGVARLHSGVTATQLRDLYVSHHSYDWYNNPLSAGACTGFRPGQFTNLFPLMIRPAGRGLLQFAGETFASNQGWILSALESGWRAVDNLLIRFNLQQYRPLLRRLFGEVPEVEGSPSPPILDRDAVATAAARAAASAAADAVVVSGPAGDQPSAHAAAQDAAQDAALKVVDAAIAAPDETNARKAAQDAAQEAAAAAYEAVADQLPDLPSDVRDRIIDAARQAALEITDIHKTAVAAAKVAVQTVSAGVEGCDLRPADVELTKQVIENLAAAAAAPPQEIDVAMLQVLLGSLPPEAQKEVHLSPENHRELMRPAPLASVGVGA